MRFWSDQKGDDQFLTNQETKATIDQIVAIVQEESQSDIVFRGKSALLIIIWIWEDLENIGPAILDV